MALTIDSGVNHSPKIRLPYARTSCSSRMHQTSNSAEVRTAKLASDIVKGVGNLKTFYRNEGFNVARQTANDCQSSSSADEIIDFDFVPAPQPQSTVAKTHTIARSGVYKSRLLAL